MKRCKEIVIIIISVIYLCTFYTLGLLLYFISKAIKIMSYVLTLNFHSAKEECQTFSKHYRTLRDCL